MTSVAVIDYGMGNLRSVQKGFEKVGFQAEITNDPARVAAAEKVRRAGVRADRAVVSPRILYLPFVGVRYAHGKRTGSPCIRFSRP